MRFVAVSVLAASLLATVPALAAGISVGAFDQVRLSGGGHLTIRHGTHQSVNLVKGSTQYTTFNIRDGHKLEIDACNEHCPMTYDLEIEIVTSDLSGVAINGGGEMVAEGAFPHQDRLAAAINGGGDMDVKAISATSVDAAVRGGGEIVVTATKELNAAVSGGGDITYHGSPQVNEAVRGGGSVSAAR